jgi:signal transduction histidine kinase
MIAEGSGASDRRLVAATIVAVVLTATALAMRVLPVVEHPPPTPEDLIAVLVGMAALCMVGLTIRRAPRAGWLAAAIASIIATLDLAASAGASRAAIDPADWSWLVGVIGASAVASATVAAGYAAAPAPRLGSWVLPVSGAGLVVVGVAAALAVVTAHRPDPLVSTESPLGSVVLTTRGLLIVGPGLIALGVAADLRPAWARARRRTALDHPAGVGPGAWAGTAGMMVRSFVEEITPGRRSATRAASTERERLAGELHAHVVPAIRDALAVVERDGSAERLGDSLRGILAEVDGLIAERHSVILEEFGLVAALEWLAERTEERSEIRVVLDVGDTADGRPSRVVERAAFRIATLALDNVARHAPRATATIALDVDGSRVDMVIEDDGPGLPPDAELAARATGRRGLREMRDVAAASGATVSILPTGARGGAAVSYRWGSRAGTRGTPRV